MSNFADLGLPEKILTALNAIHFNTPTPIQQQSIPVALQGHDILGSAQTGTGKTAAFAIPMIVHLLDLRIGAAADARAATTGYFCGPVKAGKRFRNSFRIAYRRRFHV